jgi:nicotinate-nucleotide--dimethylbenzimidazole phosphoribosyltransferase
MLDFRYLRIPSLCPLACAKAKDILNHQARPIGSLGVLDELSIQLAGMFGSVELQELPARALIMCADHGIAEENVSVFPQEVTRNICRAFSKGGTAFNLFSRVNGIQTEVIDCGIKWPVKSDSVIDRNISNGTNNISKGAAMSYDQAIQSLEIGIERSNVAASEGVRILAIGEIGNSNTSVASALFSVLAGLNAEDTVGRGTGVPDWQYEHKISVVAKALNINKPNPIDPIDCLSKLGGYEIGGMAGAILQGAANRQCVVIDGFIATVAAFVAIKLNPNVSPYIIYGHCSDEEPHDRLLKLLHARPILNLNLRLGEVTGAMLAVPLVKLAYMVLSEIDSFSTVETPNPYT